MHDLTGDNAPFGKNRSFAGVTFRQRALSGSLRDTEATMITGSQGEYSWLQVDLRLREFLRRFPGAVLSKYIAITSVDSGTFTPSDSDRAHGWNEMGGIAYSPEILSIEALPPDCCCRQCYGFDEWYIFRSRPAPLGAVSSGNPFVAEIVSPNVFRFINFGHFSLADDVMAPVANLFWKQMLWIKPEAYVGDGQDWLIFITRDHEFFAQVGGIAESRSV